MHTQLKLAVFCLLFLISLSISIVAQAPSPVLRRTYPVKGIAYKPTQNGSFEPFRNGKVVVKVSNLLTSPQGTVHLYTDVISVLSDAQGRITGPDFRCFEDSTPGSNWNTTYKVEHGLVGLDTTIAFNVASGTNGPLCNPNWDFTTVLQPTGTTTYKDLTNLGDVYPVVGQPVNVTNGNVWLSHNDYAQPGIGETIRLSRFYNSQLSESGMFGRGWMTEYDAQVKLSYSGDLIFYRTPNGREIDFVATTNGYRSGTPDFHGGITRNPDGTFTITFEDGRLHHFGSNGKLLWQRDRIGNQTTLNYDQNGNLNGVIDPFGRTLFVQMINGRVSQLSDNLGLVATYQYFGDGTLQSVNYPDNSRYQFEYAAVNGAPYLTTVRDALNNILETHQYDNQGRALTSVVEGGVESYTFDYTNSEALIPYTLVTDGLNRQSKYTFDKSLGRNVVVKSEGNCGCGSGSQVIESVYDNKLNLIKTIDALGREVTRTYDEKGRVLTITDAVGTESFTYNQFGQMTSRTDKMGAVWVNIFDTQGKLITSTDPNNGQIAFTYTPIGQPATVKDQRNNTTTLTYDGLGRVSQVTDPLNRSTSFSYDVRSRLTSVTNALGFSTAYEYDPANRIKKVTDPQQRTVQFGYDLAGRRTSITDERGFVTNYTFDGAYRLTAITNALGHTRQYSYDVMSNLIAQTDPLGNVTQFQYDALDRVTKVIYPGAEPSAVPLEEIVEYDAVGNVSRRIDTAGRQTLFSYDPINRLISSIDPNNQATQYQYNPRNQLIKVTDPIGQEYLFSFDPLGRLINQTRAGNTMSFQYDPAGNRTSRTDYKGVVTNYVYDQLNRLRQVRYPDAAENITLTYDALSRLQKAINYAGTVDFNYTSRNQVSQVLDVHGRKLNYTYDPAGNPNLVKLDDSDYLDYTFDRLNRLQLIKNVEDNTVVDYSYDAADRMVRTFLPNGITTIYQYDGMSRLTRKRDFKTNPDTSVTNLYNRGYVYNQASQIASITQPSGQTRNFSYDNLDRLTGVTGAATENYSFDSVGNRLSSHLSTAYQYAAFNRLTNTQQATFVHDANGNMTSRTDPTGTTQYIWDYENRLRKVIKPDGTSVNYKYNALGQRTERFIGANSTKFTYDGDDVILDINSDGSFVKYINGPGIDNKIRQTINGQAQYFIQDHLGSTNALTDATGNVVSSATYDAFGNATGNLSTRYQYTGREKDETTGLMYYRNRWYDSNLGRFISEDPIGLSGGINQFGYVGGNPVGFTDPSGLFPVNDVSTVTQTVTQTVSLLDQVIANTASEQNRNAKLLAEIIANSSPQAKAAAATGTASVLAYGGTSVAAAGAAPVAGTVAGGLVVGGAIGLPIGIYTSGLASNPFVNGSLNPFGTSASDVANEPWAPRQVDEFCKPIHGNSANSLRPTWGYQLFDNEGNFLKNGITSSPIPERRYTKGYMSDKYMDYLPFPNRRTALDWERNQNMTNPGPDNHERYIKR